MTQLQLHDNQLAAVLTCLECELVTKRSSRLDIHGADQTVYDQSADNPSAQNHVFTILVKRNIIHYSLWNTMKMQQH